MTRDAEPLRDFALGLAVPDRLHRLTAQICLRDSRKRTRLSGGRGDRIPSAHSTCTLFMALISMSDARPKRLRFLVFNTVAKVVHHARRTLLRLTAAVQHALLVLARSKIVALVPA